MGAIDAITVRRSEAKLRPKRPRVETSGLAAYVVLSTSTPSSSSNYVTLEAIMAQLQCMDARLDTLTDELCQVNTHVGHIARRQAQLGGFVPSPLPSLEASTDKDDVDDDENANSSSDNEMTTS